jgi:hypothetical protein
MTTELRERLEREAYRVNAATDAKVQVLDRAERRIRRRRVEAGALGLVVAFALIGGAFSILPFGARNGESARGSSWSAIWPQTTYADALSAQQALDTGDASGAWQSNGTQVVKRFASEHFGWSAPTLMTIANAAEVGGIDDPAKLLDPATTGPVRVLIDGCPPEGALSCPAAYVTVQRLIRDDPTGIWSVTGSDTTTIGFAVPSPSRSG